ncbi:MAG: hypothetical protein ACI4ET_12700 [Bilifractor sp.]
MGVTIFIAIVLWIIGVTLFKWIPVIMAIVYFGLAIYQGAKSAEFEKASPTPMRCKNCGSSDVKIQSQVTGLNIASAGVHDMGMGFVQGAAGLQRQHIYVCQHCGFSAPYITQDDLQAWAGMHEKRMKVYMALMVLSIIFTVGAFIFQAS